MNRSRNIFLIGPMGAGKSTIGRQLAEQLKMDFFDSDREIEESCGATLDWIFDLEGEDGFRLREQKMIHELTEKQGIVLATGGGTVVTPENRERLAARGVVVYLKASIEQQMDRTYRDKRRPLLQTDNRRAVLEQLDEERTSYFEEISDITIETGNTSVRSVAASIISMLSEDELA